LCLLSAVSLCFLSTSASASVSVVVHSASLSLLCYSSFRNSFFYSFSPLPDIPHLHSALFAHPLLVLFSLSLTLSVSLSHSLSVSLCLSLSLFLSVSLLAVSLLCMSVSWHILRTSLDCEAHHIDYDLYHRAMSYFLNEVAGSGRPLCVIHIVLSRTRHTHTHTYTHAYIANTKHIRPQHMYSSLLCPIHSVPSFSLPSTRTLSLTHLTKRPRILRQPPSISPCSHIYTPLPCFHYCT
jgi:hypothetical protein